VSRGSIDTRYHGSCGAVAAVPENFVTLEVQDEHTQGSLYGCSGESGDLDVPWTHQLHAGL
jgi:hypothetical protein